MELNLTKPIVFFDLEATGLDIAEDRIVEISILKIYPNGKEEQKTFIINPEKTIPKQTTKIHGITNEDVKDAPTFSQVAGKIVDMIKGCDLAGYNSNKFDIPMLAEELLRVGVDYDLKKSKFIDVQGIFFKMEQRTLKAAYKFYCGKELENAHSAEADTGATFEILKAQLERYDELKNDVGFLSKFTTQTKFADFAGRIAYNENNVEVFNFGKYKGKPVEEVLNSDPGYYGWMINGQFPRYTKKILTGIKLRSAFKK